MLYERDTWTIKKYGKERLEAMNMWIWRITTRTGWIEGKRNDTTLQGIGEKKKHHYDYYEKKSETHRTSDKIQQFCHKRLKREDYG